MKDHDTYIISACRTPIGSFMGSLAGMSAPELGAAAIQEALDRAGISPDEINEVIMGQVLTAGSGQAPARQAAKAAGIPDSVGALTLNKMCGSGLKAIMLASQAIAAGDGDIFVAGGMESMSQAPYIMPKARQGYRMGHAELIDSMIYDGLWDVYNDFHMGNAAELCAKEYAISRDMQDEYSLGSYKKALNAQKEDLFKPEIVPIEVKQRKGTQVVENDEDPTRVDLSRINQLKTAFQKDGTITAANASNISDGAAAVVVASGRAVKAHGLKPLARISAYASAALAPEWFTIAPAEAISKLLKQHQLSIKDIDLFEINEAFAVVVLAVAKKLGLSLKNINVRGGAVSLGHPIGASGARILVSLLHTMSDQDLKCGIASICLGGGEALAVLVDRGD